mgnify:CR=1 FL=1
MDALHPGIPNTHPVGRRADYPLLFRLHLSGGRRHEELIYVRTVLVHTQRGILLGIFWFGTLEAVATCITLTFTVNFAQCYWMMYRMTLHRSLRHFAIQLISPLMVSILLIAVLYPLSLMTEGGNIFLTLIVKSIIFFCIFGCYIQLTGEYDITGKAKSIINKNKR